MNIRNFPSSFRLPHATRQASPGSSGNKAQQGYILIGAILSMLILAGIALTLAKLSISQNSIVDQALLRARTELVLESAAHWATSAFLQEDDCIQPSQAQMYFNQSGTNVADPLIGYHVRFLCDPNAKMEFNEGGNTVHRFGVVLQADYNEPTYNPNDPSFSGKRAMVVRRSVMEFSQ